MPDRTSLDAVPGRSRRGRWHAARHRWRHSLKWRLVTLFLMLALATTGVFLFGMQRVVRSGWHDLAQPLLADYADRLAAEIGTPPDVARAGAIADRLPIEVRIDGPQVRFESHPDERRRRWPGRWRADAEHSGADADAWMLVRSTADGHRIGFALAAPQAGGRPRLVGWVTLAALLLLTLLAYATVRRLLRPLDDIGAGVARFGRGDFAQPIILRRRDELGDLAERINAMASSLRGMLDAKRALLLAISHELRSPLTRARVNAELVAAGEHRDALLRDLGAMRDLIADLLESERLAAGHAALQTEAVDLGELVRKVVATHFAGAGVTLDLGAAPSGPVLADPTRLELLLRNLLDNALRHGAGAAQPPCASCRREADGRLCLAVRDHGPGVDEAQRARLAEPFHRVDLARARDTGGVGLGLYLCRLVAQAHGGVLEITPARPGLEVAMRWPGGGDATLQHR